MEKKSLPSIVRFNVKPIGFNGFKISGKKELPDIVRIKVKQGFSLIELLVVIAVVAILMSTMYVGYNSVKSGAKINNYVDFIEKIHGLMAEASAKCGTNNIIQSMGSIPSLNAELQSCGVISNNVTIPSQYQSASSITIQNNNNGTYSLILAGLSQHTANAVVTAFDAKYGQVSNNGQVPTVPCSDNGGTTTTITCTFNF